MTTVWRFRHGRCHNTPGVLPRNQIWNLRVALHWWICNHQHIPCNWKATSSHQGASHWKCCINEERQGRVKHYAKAWTCLMGLHVSWLAEFSFHAISYDVFCFFSQLSHLYKTNCARLNNIGETHRAWGQSIGEKSQTLCIQHAIIKWYFELKHATQNHLIMGHFRSFHIFLCPSWRPNTLPSRSPACFTAAWRSGGCRRSDFPRQH